MVIKMKLAEWIEIEKNLKIRFIFAVDNTFRTCLEIVNDGNEILEKTFFINIIGNEIDTSGTFKLDRIEHGHTTIVCSQLAIIQTISDKKTRIKIDIMEADKKCGGIDNFFTCNFAVEGDLIPLSERSFISVKKRKLFKLVAFSRKILVALLILALIIKITNIYPVSSLFLIIIFVTMCFGIYSEVIYYDQVKKAKKIRY